MELFNELKNSSLQAITKAINTIQQTQQPIRKQELQHQQPFRPLSARAAAHGCAIRYRRC